MCGHVRASELCPSVGGSEEGGGPHQQLLVVIVERLKNLEELRLGQLNATAGRVRAKGGDQGSQRGEGKMHMSGTEGRRRCTHQAHTVHKSVADSLVCPCCMVESIVTAVALQVAHKRAANLQRKVQESEATSKLQILQ